MTETVPEDEPPRAGAGTGDQANPRLLKWIGAAALAALALVVSALRFYRLHELPAGIQVSEAMNGVDALRVLRGEHAIWFPSEFSGHEALVVYLIALSVALFDRTDLALRLPTTVANAGSVLAVFWLGRLLYARDEAGNDTKWRGLAIGAAAAGLMAVSVGQTVLGRTVFRANLLLLLLPLCVGFMWWGWRERSWRGIALAGLFAGLSQHTYIPARFVPFLFLFFGISFLPLSLAQSWSVIRRELPRTAVFAGIALLVAAPLFIFFALNPDIFQLRPNSLLVFRQEVHKGDLVGTVVRNVVEHLQAFGWRGDINWRHNFDGRPMLNPWEAFLFWLGALLALLGWRRPANRLLLLWLGFLLLPALLARDYAPNTLRMLAATPPVYLLAALGLWELYRFVEDRWLSDRFPQLKIALWSLVALTILSQGVTTFRSYFGRWAQEPGVSNAYEVPLSDFARKLNALTAAEGVVYLIPSSMTHPSLGYIYRGESTAHYFPRETFDLNYLAGDVQSALLEAETLQEARVIQLNDRYEGAVGNDTGRVPILLEKYGRYTGSEEFTYFSVHYFDEISLDEDWTFYDRWEALSVRYDGGIMLQGFAMGQEETQLRPGAALQIEPGLPLWIALKWSTVPDLETNFSISLRLYDHEERVVHQQDAVLWNPLHIPTSQWKPEEEVDTVFQLNLPEDLAAGGYHLRLVVYNVETLVPTVQVEVWEPEFTIADLRLVERN